jgi:hypothetical protein
MSDQPRIKMNNSSTSQGGDRWKWSVWIDGDGEQLDQIDRVEYVLHPTFPQPVRTVSDRHTNFRLDSQGWGEFMVHAKAVTKNGETLPLNHWLKLSDEGGIVVLTENQFSPDEPIDRGIKAFIGWADAVLALVAPEPGRWVLAEISEAQRQQKPILAMLLGKDAVLPESLAEVMAFRIEGPNDTQKATAILEQELARLKL